MRHVFRGPMVFAVGVALLWIGTALAGLTDAEKCEAANIKEVGN